jgi:hypothetical protein
LNDIGRNSSLGNRKKIAKFLMRTFTCRFTFLYDIMYRIITVLEGYREWGGGRGGYRGVRPIEIDTLDSQQIEKIETEMKDVYRIRIRKVYACCPGWPSGGS